MRFFAETISGVRGAQNSCCCILALAGMLTPSNLSNRRRLPIDTALHFIRQRHSDGAWFPSFRRGVNEVFARVVCLFRNVDDFQPTLHNIQEEPRSHIVRTFGNEFLSWYRNGDSEACMCLYCFPKRYSLWLQKTGGNLLKVWSR